MCRCHNNLGLALIQVVDSPVPFRDSIQLHCGSRPMSRLSRQFWNCVLQRTDFRCWPLAKFSNRACAPLLRRCRTLHYNLGPGPEAQGPFAGSRRRISETAAKARRGQADVPLSRWAVTLWQQENLPARSIISDRDQDRPITQSIRRWAHVLKQQGNLQ